MNLLKWLFCKKQKKIKLGLALGSGGAKGFAHLGALKAFEENDIQFDIIAGSSIGSIIGAFYADGYSSTDIFELLKSVDANEIKNFFMVNMNTFGLYSIINKSIGYKNIEELKKTFRAIGTEVDTGKEHIFESGNVAKALCASSCYPPFFKPVIIDNVRYVDGAFTNSVPADVVKALGADYVVGIDLANHQSKPSLLTKVFPSYKSEITQPWEKGYKYSNVMLHPDLKGYRSISFQHGMTMYDIGYACAIENIAKIKAEIKAIKK